MESRVLSRATAFSSLPRLPNKLPRQPPNASFLPLKTTIADGSCGVNQLSTNWGSTQLLPVLSSPAPRREAVRIKPCSAAATSSAAESSDSGGGNVVVATFFFFTWFILNLVFNILNKTIFNYFPYPYFVSAIQLFVGVVYSLLSWAVGLPKPARIDSRLVMMLIPVAVFHALGHVASNVSFASVAISFTHTIKALEPFFNVAASQFILGQSVPITLWLSLAPVVIGVSVASLTELSFNRIGLISAMISNISVTFRSIYSKKAMTEMDSTNVYAYITIIALFVCIPPAIIVEGPALLNHGINDAIAKVGLVKFVSDLFLVGISYHLYNQVATNTLERVPPLTNAFGNVLKRVSVIGLSILFFGTTISNQTAIGTAVAISGVALYSFIKAKIEEDKRQGKA